MATEIRKVLNLSLGESPKNLRELKQDINEIKSAIGDMVVAGQTGTTAFDQATKLLAQDMGVLRQTQNATKSEVAALDGSYNALVQTMRQLKTEWRATNDEARRGELTAQITAINDQLKSLDYSLGNYQRNVGNYGNALDSLKQTTDQVQGAGAAFSNGLIALSGTLNLTKSESDSLNSSLGAMQKTFNIMNAAKGLLGLVKAFKDKAAAMRAAKAETVAETAAIRTQTVATNAQTVSTEAATVAQKGLNTAMKANPIGAVVAAVLAAVAALTALATAIFRAHSRMKEYESQVDSVRKAQEKLNTALEEAHTRNSNLEKVYRAMGIEGRQLIDIQRAQIQSDLRLAKAHLAVAEAAEARYLNELRLESRSAVWIAFHKGRIKQMDEFAEATRTAAKTVEDLEDALRATTYDYLAADITAANEAAKKGAEAAKKQAEELRKTAEEGQKLITEIEKEGLTEREKAHREYQEKLHSLVEGRDAEVTIAKAAGLPTKDIFDKYNKAAIQLYDQYLKSLDPIYSEEFRKYADNEKKKLDLQQEYYKQARSNVRRAVAMGFDINGSLGFTVSQADLDIIQHTLNEYTEKIQEYIVKFRDVLGNEIKPNDLKKLLPEFLSDPDSFEKRFGQPMTDAIKEYFETTKSIEEAGLSMIANSVEAQTNRIWDLINDGNVKGADSAITSLTDFILRAEKAMGVEDMGKEAANQLKEGFYLQMAQTEGLDKDQALKFLDEWKKLAEEGAVDGGLERIKEKYKQLVAEIKYNSLEKNLIKPLDAVANMLGNVAQAWENTIRAQVDAGKKSEEEGRKAFERMKILQYGTAVISTASAVVQALADPTVPSYILKAINAAAALAAGVAQVAQISATHYGSSGSNSTSTPQLVDRTPVQQTVSLNAAEAGQGVAQSMRVYVVESDITEAQNKTRARVTESTF